MKEYSTKEMKAGFEPSLSDVKEAAEVNIKTALGQYSFVNWSKFTVANAFILKSKTGSFADQSCEGWPAVCIIKLNLIFLNIF